MKITLENFESTINDITVGFILENAKLTARLNDRKWMTKTEYFEYAMSMDIQTINEIMDFMKVNNLGEFEEGTTPRNMMDQLGENMRLTTLLKNKGKTL